MGKKIPESMNEFGFGILVSTVDSLQSTNGINHDVITHEFLKFCQKNEEFIFELFLLYWTNGSLFKAMGTSQIIH